MERLTLRGEAHRLLERLARLDSSAHDGGTLRAREIESIGEDVVLLHRRVLAMEREGVAGPGVREEVEEAARCLREAHALVRRLLLELGEG